MGERSNEIVTVRFQSPYEAEIRNIRGRVFSDEQKIDPRIDFDGRDAEAVHVLIREAGQYVATGRMLRDGRIGRMAVLKPWRRKGLGRQIIATLLAEAGKQGIPRVCLSAQQPVVGFYQKLGFYPLGEPFIKVGIAHRHMAKDI